MKGDRKRLAALKKAQQAAQTPSAQAKRTAGIRAYHARRRAQQAAQQQQGERLGRAQDKRLAAAQAEQVRYPVAEFIPGGRQPNLELEGDRPRPATSSKLIQSAEQRLDLARALVATVHELINPKKRS